MASTASNRIKFLLATKAINFASDSFKIILMASGFVFDKDAHHDYATIVALGAAGELATGNGYTRNTKTLSGVVATAEDDTDDRMEVTWSNATWTASGGSIGPTPGAIIFDDSVTTPTVDPIVGYIDFGGEQTQVDGGVGTISNIEFRIA